jgi:hypothetical protein
MLYTDGIPWLPIHDDFPDYFANERGEILSRRQNADGMILKTWIGDKGYPYVTLYRTDGRKRCFKVHQLIALAFHGPRPPGLVARHFDGDQLNNVPGNIFYGTYSENAHDQVRHGRHPEASKTECYKGHPLTGDNLRIDPKGVRRCKRCHADNIAAYRARRKRGDTPLPPGRPRRNG